MLRSWSTKIPNMNKIQQKTNDKLCTQDVRTDVWSNKHEKGCTQGLGTDERTDGQTDMGIPVYPPLCEGGAGGGGIIIPWNFKKAGVKCRLLTRTYSLQADRAKFSRGRESDMCNLCKISHEDTRHFLLECSYLEDD